MNLMGGAGMASVAAALLIMGAHIDSYEPGAALRMMALLGVPLVIAFLAFWIYFNSRGGYRRSAADAAH